MKKLLKLATAMLLVVAVVCTTGCKKSSENNISGDNGSNNGGGTNIDNVIVTTFNPTNISVFKATCGVEAIAEDINKLEQIGVCWCDSILGIPTIQDLKRRSFQVDEPFICTITNRLAPLRTYYVRGYALYDGKYYYGDAISFKTLGGGGNGSVPTGAIHELFTVGNNRQVYFSKGNLQYQASTNTWRFAENQWDFIGGTDNQTGIRYGNVFENGIQCDNALASNTYSGWIDLYGWGTSGYNHGAICYQPWSKSPENECYYPYGNNKYTLYDQSGQADWGYNRIINGGNQENCWRTLTYTDLYYLLDHRKTSSGMRYTKAIINGTEGLVIFPDNWESSYYNINAVNDNNSSYSSNVISLTIWQTVFEVHGAVFLPSAGFSSWDGRYFNTVRTGRLGYYWMSDLNTYYSSPIYNPYMLLVLLDDLREESFDYRPDGFSVRLVQDYQ